MAPEEGTIAVFPTESPLPALGLLLPLDEIPHVHVLARSPEDLQALREYLLLPSTRRALADALFDALDELEEWG
ncbi:MAG TPA: hypothetical protein VNK94_11695 [Gaiellaceae bacterium]|nr:hypothetical protein [Gaiellaceae bacterium]